MKALLATVAGVVALGATHDARGLQAEKAVIGKISRVYPVHVVLAPSEGFCADGWATRFRGVTRTLWQASSMFRRTTIAFDPIEGVRMLVAPFDRARQRHGEGAFLPSSRLPAIHGARPETGMPLQVALQVALHDAFKANAIKIDPASVGTPILPVFLSDRIRQHPRHGPAANLRLAEVKALAQGANIETVDAHSMVLSAYLDWTMQHRLQALLAGNP